jgi:hypothetical protein
MNISSVKLAQIKGTKKYKFIFPFIFQNILKIFVNILAKYIQKYKMQNFCSPLPYKQKTPFFWRLKNN